MADSESKGRIRTMTLTRPQWEVAEKIRQRLEDATPWIEARNERVRAARTRYERPLSSATRVLPLEAPPGFADVDQERLDRAVLIDGHRGEGKTSVLMKLLDTWNQEALRALRGDPPLRAPKKKPKSAKDSARDSRESREDFTVTLPERVFVVSLPTLDLPAMPRGQDVPLASLVLNCFSSLVAELVDDARRSGRGPSDHGSSHSQSERHDRDDRATEPLRECWDWLHRSLASKYAHASKRSKDDLLQYAREVQDDTRRVYEIDDRFRLFIDALSAAVQRYFRTDKLPVFVVAIDDLDLAAHATIDLLDVLRVFQHPAVFFLMTGDYENLHRCVRNAPSMQALFNANDGEREVKFGRSALASDVIERIFPRDNVCKLTPPTLDERLGVRWRDDRTVRDLLVDLGPTVPLFASVAKNDERAKQRISRALPSQLR
jgi:hypothetical protein